MARRRPPRPRGQAPAARPTADFARQLPPDAIEPSRRFRHAAAVAVPTACSAVLLWLCFPLPDAGWLAWVALVPWVVVVLRARTNAVVWATWPIWMGWWVVMMAWLRFATPLGWIALCVYLSLYFPVAALLLRFLSRRHGLPAVVSLPVVWVGLEYVRSRAFTGFGWFLLGHTQHARVTIIQVADLVGVAGVSVLVAAVNGLVVDLLVRPIFRPRASGGRTRLRLGAVVSAAGVGALVVGVLLYGRYRLAEAYRTVGEGLKVAAIQGNIPQDVKQSGRDDFGIMEQHLDLSMETLDDRPDLLVWPETMVPGSINREFLDHEPEHPDPKTLARIKTNIILGKHFRSQVADLAAMARAPILVGNVTTDRIIKSDWRRFNTALLIEPDGRTAGRYSKMHLVPFGEYIPLRRTFPWLMDLTPYDYDYTVEPGSKPTVFEAGGSRFAVAICFESTVPQVCRRLAYEGGRKRIDFLVNVSNDGWFRASGELPQHLAICAFRAVENRVGIVRAVNTGISAFIDPNGRVVKDLRTAAGRRGVAGTLTDRVATDSRRSLYGRWGDWLSQVLAGLLGAVSIYGVGGFAVTRVRAWRAKKRGSR